jgi:hypothetical protein
MQLLRFILNNQSACSECVSTARDSMVLKAFLEAPSELWVMVSNLEPGLFTLLDLQRLVASLGDLSVDEVSAYDSAHILSWVVARQRKGKLGPGFDRLIGNRSIMGTLRHSDSLLLMVGLVKEQEAEVKMCQSVG